MTRRQVLTFQELWERASTEWEEVPHGYRLILSEDPVRASRDRLEVRLTKAEAAKFRPRPREKFVARFSRGRLIVERAARPQRKRAHRG